MALPKLTSEASLTSGRPMMSFPEWSLEMLVSEKGPEREKRSEVPLPDTPQTTSKPRYKTMCDHSPASLSSDLKVVISQHAITSL